MAARNLGTVWDRGADFVFFTRDAKTNVVNCTFGDAATEKTESVDAELWQQAGFASLPAKPTKGASGAQVLFLRGGDRDAVIATRDARSASIYGQLTWGETALFATGEDGTGQARIFLKKDGSISLYTREGNTASGQGLIIQVDPQTDRIMLVNSLGYGIVIDTDGVKIIAGDSCATFGSDGNLAIIAKQQAQLDGASVNLGAVIPPTANVTNAVIKGPTGLAGVPSLKVFVE